MPHAKKTRTKKPRAKKKSARDPFLDKWRDNYESRAFGEQGEYLKEHEHTGDEEPEAKLLKDYEARKRARPRRKQARP